jgi:cell wall-associated NlpC family hydrolase
VLGTLSAPKIATPKAAVSGSALIAVAYAVSKLGAGYSWGASGPSVFDCSGLTSAAWRSAGVSLPRTADAQWKNLPRVSLSSLRPGDLIAFGYGSGYANHIGIYVGGGYLIDTASKYGGNVGRGKLSARAGGGSWRVLGAVRPKGSTYTAPKPAPKPAPKSGAAVAPVPHEIGPVYVVQPGDWLSKIADKFKTKGGWRYLYDLNRPLVGPNPNLIYPGQKIRLS